MLVEISVVRPLGYKAIPVGKVWRKKFSSHMQEYTGRKYSSVFFQENYDLPEEVTSNGQYPELQKGWTIVIHVDPWDYGHWLGYDAHTVAER